jgi:hypothetical protein
MPESLEEYLGSSVQPLRINLLNLGPHWPCNLLPNVKLTSPWLSDYCTGYKRPPTLQAGGMRCISPFAT